MPINKRIKQFSLRHYLSEPEAEHFKKLILDAASAKMSAGNYLETCLKIDYGSNEVSRLAFEDSFKRFGIEITEVTVPQIKIARRANQVYGRGSGHKAKLNFGDCFAYALAKDLDDFLLFKGDDFIHTDIKKVRWQ